jgi:hypothetical protein
VNGTHQLLVCGDDDDDDDDDILGKNINTIKRSIEAVLKASWEIGLEGNTRN